MNAASLLPPEELLQWLQHCTSLTRRPFRLNAAATCDLQLYNELIDVNPLSTYRNRPKDCVCMSVRGRTCFHFSPSYFVWLYSLIIVFPPSLSSCTKLLLLLYLFPFSFYILFPFSYPPTHLLMYLRIYLSIPLFNYFLFLSSSSIPFLPFLPLKFVIY